MMDCEVGIDNSGHTLSRRQFLDDCSFEITARDAAALQAQGTYLPSGTAISITFLPGNSVDELIEAAKQVRLAGFVPVPHISARRIRSIAELDRFLSGLKSAGQIDRLFIIGGDPDKPAGPFTSALDVINTGLLGHYGVRQVGVAGYPEGHPQLSSSVLRQALLDKVAALSGQGVMAEIVTQFAFDVAPVLDWLVALRESGVSAPVRVGLPGPASVKSLLRFATRCGVTASTKVLAKYGISITRLLGMATPDLLVDALVEGLDPVRHGTVRAHLYPFGGVARSAGWLAGQVGSTDIEGRRPVSTDPNVKPNKVRG